MLSIINVEMGTSVWSGKEDKQFGPMEDNEHLEPMGLCSEHL